MQVVFGLPRVFLFRVEYGDKKKPAKTQASRCYRIASTTLLVEKGGVEPPSESTPPLVLHA